MCGGKTLEEEEEEEEEKEVERSGGRRTIYYSVTCSQDGGGPHTLSSLYFFIRSHVCAHMCTGHMCTNVCVCTMIALALATNCFRQATCPDVTSGSHA